MQLSAVRAKKKRKRSRKKQERNNDYSSERNNNVQDSNELSSSNLRITLSFTHNGKKASNKQLTPKTISLI